MKEASRIDGGVESHGFCCRGGREEGGQAERAGFCAECLSEEHNVAIRLIGVVGRVRRRATSNLPGICCWVSANSTLPGSLGPGGDMLQSLNGKQ